MKRYWKILDDCRGNFRRLVDRLKREKSWLENGIS